jgi:hypothetical protein
VPFGVVPTITSITETDWTIDGNWTTEMGASDLQPADWLNDQWGPAARDLISSSNFGSEVKLDTVKVYPIRTPDGHAQPAFPYAHGSPITLAYTGTHPSGSGSNQVPAQISAVTSLRSHQVGPKGRGRVFLPPFPVSMLTAGTLTSTARDSIAAALQTFLEACYLDGSGPGGVWARPVVTGAPYLNYSTVSQVSVDSIPDTQRRRRKSLVGSRSTITLAT